MNKKKLIISLISILILCALVVTLIFATKAETKASEISVEEAEKIINTQLDNTAKTDALKYVAGKNNIKVNSIEYGSEKDAIALCTISTVDVQSVLTPEYNRFMSSDVRKTNGTMFKSSLDFKMEFEQELLALVQTAPTKTLDIKISLYETKKGFEVHTSNEVINSVYGGIIDIEKDLEKITEVEVTNTDGTVTTRKIESNNIKKGFINCIKPKYEKEKPDVSGWLGKTWNKLKKDFHKNFIKEGRWKTIFAGLWVTIKLTFFAIIIGIILGFLVAFVRCTYLKNTKHSILLRILNGISQTYLTIIRGTPAVVQIMIIYFVIFMPMGVDKFIAAVICFGLNSGAYVAEIVRGGIMSIDNGQTEAGRSLGFGYMQTMWYIVFPQAFKAVLPALANEFVVLLKETSVAFYIGLGDLMYAGNAIRAATYTQFMPLVAVAIIYLIMVLALSKCVSILERRLRNSER